MLNLISIGNARRVDPKGGFFTLMTSSAPGGKYTAPIHYSVRVSFTWPASVSERMIQQRRTFSVAERKRAQGVPDTYRLVGTVIEVSPPIKARKGGSLNSGAARQDAREYGRCEYGNGNIPSNI